MQKRLAPLKDLNFGSAIYRIEYVDKLLGSEGFRKLSGNINHEKCVIQIDPAANAQSIVETFLHEAIHFFLEHYGQGDAINQEREEDVINTLSNGMLLIMRLNPELVKLIQEL